MVDPLEFRAALSRFASGVAVVTTLDEERPHGITVTAFMPVSDAPPHVAVSIANDSRTHGILGRGGPFGVSVLREGQEAVSDHFANRPSRSPGRLDFEEGLPFVVGSLARLRCAVVRAIEAGDHTIYVGEVESGRVDEGCPLVHGRGRYHGLEDHE